MAYLHGEAAARYLMRDVPFDFCLYYDIIRAISILRKEARRVYAFTSTPPITPARSFQKHVPMHAFFRACAVDVPL